jgi:hypothetical protein
VIDCRAFLAGTGMGLLAGPLVAEAQQAGKVPRIGWLGNQPVSGVKGWRVLRANSIWDAHPEALDHDVVMIFEVVVQDLASAPQALLRPLFDRMWRRGGWARSPSYSAEGIHGNR